MAEESLSTPRLTGKLPEYFATPESWEMRAEAQTPAQNLPDIAPSHEEVTPPQSVDDGWSDSLGTCMDFAMYETPPGAYMYRDQGVDDSFDMSYEEMGMPGGTAEVSYNGGTAELTPINSPPPADKKGECASPTPDSSFCQDEQNYDDIAVDELSPSTEASARQEIVNSDPQEHVMSNKLEVDQTEYEECIFERLDRQQLDQQDCYQEDILSQIQEDCPSKTPLDLYPTRPDDDPVTSPMSSPLVDPKLHQLQSVSEPWASPKIDSGLASDQHPIGVPDAVLEYASPEKGKIDLYEVSSAASPGYAERESQESNEIFEKERGMNKQARTESTSPTEHMNTSLIIMGAPHNAQELDQLAEFLNMADPFEKPAEEKEKANPDDVCLSQSDAIGCKEGENVSVKDEKIIELPTPPKKRRRAKKANAVVERRRSVRIARRESLLSAPPSSLISADTSLHSQQSNNGDNIAGMEQGDKDTDKMDCESEYVPHPFPEVGMTSPQKSSSVEHCNAETVPLEVSSPLRMQPNEEEIFNHLNIDLPMPQKKKKTSKGRRRSVRLSLQNIKLEGSPPVSAKPEVEERKSKCDSGFLADFADFGLGDDWMPGDMFGESQFAKTPKEKSGRRKSARLSGVHIPLLQLTAKSELRIISAIEEETKTEKHIDDHLMEDEHLTTVPKTRPIDKICEEIPVSGYENMESLTDFLFEKKDEVQLPRQKRKSSSKRRRSIRLSKQPQDECMETTPQQGIHEEEPSKVAAKSKKKRIAGTQLNVLQEVKVMSCDNTHIESPVEEAAFTELKAQVIEGKTTMVVENMDVGNMDDDIMDIQETISLAANRISKDTPLMGRKRVSRITEEDKENDDALEQHQKQNRITPSGNQKQRRQTASVDVDKDVQPGKGKTAKVSEKDNFKVSKKIRDLYLKKGGVLKKHNLETIFESPKTTAGNLLGGRKLKRTIAFTETPWLGRTGRTKGRKVKKGKEVKRVLTSKVEKSWKLDMRLSSLEESSP